MNKLHHKIFAALVIIIAAGTSYLAVQKYIAIQEQTAAHQQRVQDLLENIQSQLAALQENEQEVIAEEIIIPEDLNEQIDQLNQSAQAPRSVIEITTQDDLRTMLKNNNGSSVIFFHMDGCGWCTKMKPVFEQVAQSNDFKAIQFYNVDGRSAQAPSVVKELLHESINGYPFFLFINGNNIAGTQSGFSDQQKFENNIKGSFRTLFPNFAAPQIIGKPQVQQAPSGCGHSNQQVADQPILPKPDNVIEINGQDDLKKMFEDNKKQSVIFFHMDGCGWCKKMTPVFYQVAHNKEFEHIQFYDVNGRSAQAPVVVKELFNEQINGYPFFLFIDENGVVNKQSGFSDQQKFETKMKESFLKN